MTTAAGRGFHLLPSRLQQLLSLFYGMSNGLLRKIQSIQSAAARLVTDHITPVLRQLHCLSVRRRVDYKIACLIYQSLAGQTPPYLDDDIQLVNSGAARILFLGGHTVTEHSTYCS